MTSYYGEVGLLSRAGSQEQAPPCISIILHPCSSQGPGTKSKESLLSITKLFNTVISRIFFIPSPFAIGNETWWKIWCIVLHTNKGLGYPYPSRLWGIVPATIRNAFSDSWVLWKNKTITLFIVSAKQRRKIRTTGCVGWDYYSTLAHVLTLARNSPGSKLAELKHDFRAYEPCWTKREQHIQSTCSICCFLPCNKYKNSWLVLSYQMYVGERKALADIPTKFCQSAPNPTFVPGRETEIVGLFDSKHSCSARVSPHFIWLLPTQRGEEEKDR